MKYILYKYNTIVLNHCSYCAIIEDDIYGIYIFKKFTDYKICINKIEMPYKNINPLDNLKQYFGFQIEKIYECDYEEDFVYKLSELKKFNEDKITINKIIVTEDFDISEEFIISDEDIKDHYNFKYINSYYYYPKIINDTIYFFKSQYFANFSLVPKKKINIKGAIK